MAEVTELVTRFSFVGNTAPLARYNAGLGKSIGLLAGLGAALTAGSILFSRWASSVLQASEATAQLSRNTGESIAWIQEMGFAASQRGSDVQTFESTVDSLADKIGEAAQKGSEDFARLGISVRDANGEVKSVEQVLGEVQTRFQQMDLSRNEQRSFASALGIDESLLQLLNSTSEEVNQLRARARELGTLNEEQTEQVIDYNNALSAMNFGLNAVKQMIAIGVAPELTNLAEKFTDLLADNREWVVDGINATVELLGELMSALARLTPVLLAGAGAFTAAKVATLGFSGALALLFSPALLIAAGIAGILLVVDDLIVALQGGKSFIRDFFMEFFGWDIVPVLDDIIAGFRDIVALAQSLATGDLAGAWDIIVRNARGILPEAAPVNPASGPTLPSSGRLSPEEIPSVPGQNVDNRTVEQTNNIEVKTSDPERAGRSVNDALQRQLQDAQSQFDRGGK